MLAPIIVFAYCRLEHTIETLEALNNNVGVDQTDLFIYSDAAKDESKKSRVAQVRDYLDKYLENNNFKHVKIIKATTNKGLANSIISGVSEVINLYGKAIIVEDDLIVSKDFIFFMNDCLTFYKKDKRVGAISGYTNPIKFPKKYGHDIFLTHTGNSWGWATWKEVWNQVDWQVKDYCQFQFDKKSRRKFNNTQFGISNMLDAQMQGKIDSWAVRWDYHFYKNSLLTIYPTVSRVRNDGFDNSGTHCTSDLQGKKMAVEKESKFKVEDISINTSIIKQTASYGKVSILRKIQNRIKKK